MQLAKDHDFAVWAFGENTWVGYLVFDKDGIDLMNAWNKLHGDKLMLDPTGGVAEDMEKMKQIWRNEMDKKMAKVTKQMKTAGRDIKKGKPKAALKALKGAVKKNVKLTKIDRKVRDPEIKAYKKMKKKGC